MKKFVLAVILIAGAAYYTYPSWKEFVPQEITSRIDKFKPKIVKDAPEVVAKSPKVEKKSNFRVVGSSTSSVSSSGDSAIGRAFRNRTSDVQVRGSGQVIRVLSDDRKGSRHQRFILKLSSGQTLLVAHNIDLAPRINSLRVGDTVEFNGEYEWNSKGGVIHWTHHDPPGGSSHADGWLKHRGRTYK